MAFAQWAATTYDPRMVRWNRNSNVSDVLSLGPRTAGRLVQIGVRTVAELVAASPPAMARRVADQQITAEVIGQWQREAQLIIAAPQLPAPSARVLAAAGFYSVERLIRSSPTEVLAVLEQLRHGGRANWLTDETWPTISDVAGWILCARESHAGDHRLIDNAA